MASLAEKLPALADYLDNARDDILSFTPFPKEIWRQIWSNQSAREIQPGNPTPHGCCRDLPHRTSSTRLVGTVLAEQHDEWTEMRRYIGIDIIARSRLQIITTDPTADTSELTENLEAISA